MSHNMTLVPTEQLDQLFSELRELRRTIEGATIIPRPEWLSVPEAAKAKGVTTATVRRWIMEGRVEARGSGRAREVRIG